MTVESDIGQDLVDELVAILDLERIEQDIFRGRSPAVTLQRVFGGQVAGQALTAAVRTVDADRHVHSLHSYFIRPGDPAVPIVYTVDRVRDGRSFTTRRVVAIQHGQPIFALSASFQLDQDGLDHQSPMPAAPPPDETPTLAELRRRAPHQASMVRWPLDVRYVDPPSWLAADPAPIAVHRVWMRASGRLPDDRSVHACVLTYASDLTLLDTTLRPHGRPTGDRLKIASLDHAVWFHRPFRADEWFLYAQETPSASGGRGLALGRIFTEGGRHVATVVQEGMIRVTG